MADKKIQIDLSLVDKSTSTTKKFEGNIDKALDSIKNGVKSTTSQFDKLKTSMANVSKPISAMKQYNDQIKQTEASIKKLSTESSKIKSISATATAATGIAGKSAVASSMSTGGAVTTGLAAGIGSGALGKSGGVDISGIKDASKSISDLIERNKSLEIGISNLKNQMSAYVDIIGGTKTATDALSKAEAELATNKKIITNHTEKLNTSNEKLSKTTSTKLIPGWLKIVAVLYTVGRLLKSSYTSYSEAIDAETKLSGVLKATGYTAGHTTEELKKYATELQGLTTYGDEVIVNTMAVLASFRNIRGDVFKGATESILDMATVMGTDAQSAALQLGKALNDPIDGISSLTRVGVSFSNEQKKQIENFIKLGDVASAQKIILKEIQYEFGEVAKEMAKTDVGKIKQMANAWDDTKEKIGQFVAGMIEKWSPLIGWMLEGLNTIIDKINDILGFKIAEDLKTAEADLITLQEDMIKNQKILNDLTKAQGYGVLTNPNTGAPQLAAKIEEQQDTINKLKSFIEKTKVESAGIEKGKNTPYTVDTSEDEVKKQEEQAAKLLELRKKLSIDMVGIRQGQYAQELAIIKQQRDEELKIVGLTEEDKSRINAVATEKMKALFDEQSEYKRQVLEKEAKQQQAYVDAVKDMEISIAEIKGNYREADLLALNVWYEEQLRMLGENEEAKAKLIELYRLQAQEIFKSDTQKWVDEAKSMKVTIADVAETFSSGMSSAFDGLIGSSKSFKETFNDMANNIVNNIIKMIAEMYIYKAVAAGVSWAGGTSWGGKMGFADGGITPPMPGAANGAVFNGPKSGYPVMMHGNEAVIPLKHGKVPVELGGDKQKATVVNMYISTPDVNSFKRSRSQIVSDVRRSFQ